MINSPNLPSEDLINQIMEDVDFFSKNVILYSEREQYYQVSDIVLHPSCVNDKPQGFYINTHPKYDPVNLSPQNVFRSSNLSNPQNPDYSLLLTEPPKIYFCFLGTSSDASSGSWFIYIPKNLLILHVPSNSFEFLKPSVPISIKSNSLLITNGEIQQKYPLKAFPSEKNGAATVESVCNLLGSGFSSAPSKPYEYFYQSMTSVNKIPPIGPLLTFYQSIVENPHFLYIFSLAHTKAQMDTNVVTAWIEAAGANFASLLPLMLYHYFGSLGEPNLVMRSDCFLTYTISRTIEKDESFTLFLDTINVQADDIVEEFLTSFSKVQFSSFARFVLYHVFNEAKRCFPDQGSEYFAVSGILFLRLMTSTLLKKYPNMNTKIKSLTPVYNITESQISPDVSQRMKSLLDQFGTYPSEFALGSFERVSENSINVLFNTILSDPAAFSDTAKRVDIMKHINSYVNLITGKTVEEINDTAEKPVRQQQAPKRGRGGKRGRGREASPPAQRQEISDISGDDI